jgi:lysozyme
MYTWLKQPKSSITKKLIPIAVLTTLLSGIGLGAGFYFGLIRIQEPDRQQYPIQGIDISAFQKQIDWQKLDISARTGGDRSETDFIIIKATEGGDFKDPSFPDNWRNAGQKNLTRGAYHFFTFCKPGKIQAQNFINSVPIETNTLPPIIDLEFIGNCKTKPSVAALKQELQDYIIEVQKNYHQTPILYTTQEFYDAYLQHEFTPNPIWISNFYSQPRLADGRRWTLWQYTERGKINGIETLVDRNVFNGSKEQFQQLLNRDIQ